MSRISPEGSLVLDDDGLELPDDLHGYEDGFTIRVPTATIQFNGGAAALTTSDRFPLVAIEHYEVDSENDSRVKNPITVPDLVGIKRHRINEEIRWFRVLFETPTDPTSRVQSDSNSEVLDP